MKRNYNFERTSLILPEYGRHIHQMVDYLLTIEDRDDRSKQARAVIAVMGNLNSMLRDTADFTHKLWDHLFILSKFQLDVDSPYPIPTAETLSLRTQKLAYPTKRVKMKHYGKHVENLLSSLDETGDAGARKELVSNVARFMRTKSYEYNQEHPSNEVIIKDIKRLSNNQIELDEVALNNLKSDYKQGSTSYSKGKQSRNVKGKGTNVRMNNNRKRVAR